MINDFDVNFILKSYFHFDFILIFKVIRTPVFRILKVPEGPNTLLP